MRGGVVWLRLGYCVPFDWGSLIRFLRAHAISGVEFIDGQCYRRSVFVDGMVGVIEVRFVAGEEFLLLGVPSAFADVVSVVERVRRIFDLTADSRAFANYLGRDSLLASVVQVYPGLRVPGAWDGFEMAVRIILGQQVSLAAANTLAGRLVRGFGEAIAVEGEDRLLFLFPTPERLATADIACIGVTPKRALAIQALARVVSSGVLDFSANIGLEQIISQLIALPGIGSWTAHYIAMRAFGEMDAFPAGDLILRRVAAEPGKMLTESQLLKRAEVWRPMRAYAALYLWTDYLASKDK